MELDRWKRCNAWMDARKRKTWLVVSERHNMNQVREKTVKPTS